MDNACIPYARVPGTSALFADYIGRFERVAGFYDGSPFELPSYRSLAQAVSFSKEQRSRLTKILDRQNQALGAGPETRANVERLADPNTFAVVTGQQVGLFTGPAFTLYKALTAVRLAQHLAEQGLRAVPIFWLATEDHDLAEVSSTATLNEEYERIELRDAGVSPAAKPSVGQVRLSSEIARTLDQLEQSLPAGEPRQRLLEDLRASYCEGVGWGEAFGRFLARVFRAWGVVLLDPLDAEVHELAQPVYAQAVTKASEFRAGLLERSSALARAGYHAQVHVAPDSTLLFAAREGNRQALHQRDGKLLLDGIHELSPKDLQKWLSDRPLDFSPNVLLRPLVQDVLLPTVAYIAGPSELAYFAQAQVLYKTVGRPFPVIFPRAGFTLVDGRIQRILEKYKLTVEDVWQGKEHLNRKIAETGFAEGWAERLDQSERDLTTLLERLRKDIEQVDPTLLDTLKHTEEKMRYQMERLKGKISRAALERSELLGKHEQSLLRFLMPHQGLQEREVSGVYFLGRAGYEVLEQLCSRIQTDSATHQVFHY